MALGLWLGMLVGSSYFEPAMVEKRRLAETASWQEQRLNALNEELARVKSAADIDKRSLRQVQRSLVELQSALTDSEEELWLYRHLLQERVGEEEPFGSTVKLTAGSAAGTIGYKLLIYQNGGKKHKRVKIGYMLAVKGEQGGEKQVFPVEAGGKDVGARTAEFKYFHLEEGSFMLPDGFAPDTVEVRIWRDKDVASAATQTIPWRLAGTGQ